MNFVYVTNTRPIVSESGIEMPPDNMIDSVLTSAGRTVITDDQYNALESKDTGTAYIPAEDATAAIANAETAEDITAALDALERKVTYPDELDNWIASNAFAAYLQEQAEDKVSTGFPRLDAAIGGGFYTGMYVLSGDTGLGKTTFAWQIATQIASKTNRTVVYVTMELTTGDLVAKSVTKATGKRIDECKDTEIENALHTFASSVGNRLHVKQDGYGLESSDLLRYMQRYDRPIVFVDYLQALTPSGKFYDMRNAIDSAVHALRDYCKENRAIMIVLSSLNRTNYGKGASMAAIKESGGIEYTADCVIGLQLRCIEDDDYVNAPSDEERAAILDNEINLTERRITAKVLKTRKAAPKQRVYYRYRADISNFEELNENPKPPATKQKYNKRSKKDSPIGNTAIEVCESIRNFNKATGDERVKLDEIAGTMSVAPDRVLDMLNKDGNTFTVDEDGYVIEKPSNIKKL